jgi:hypothetical protein
MHPRCGRLAPNAANRQPIQLIVLQPAERETVIGRIYWLTWVVQAPRVIAVCAFSSQAWTREGDHFIARLIDAAIVADHLIRQQQTWVWGHVKIKY